MSNFDFTQQGRRPTTAQIIAAWKRAGKPESFYVEYGETFADFRKVAHNPDRWYDSGNGCRGVNRDAVVKALQGDGA